GWGRAIASPRAKIGMEARGNPMRIRYFACWLLGVWIAGSMFMIMVATQNFRSVDRLLAEPRTAAPIIQQMGHDAARTFLRYQISEQNRWYFETWEETQLWMLSMFASFSFFLNAASWPEVHRDKTVYNKISGITIVLIMSVLATEHFYLTPEIIR